MNIEKSKQEPITIIRLQEARIDAGNAPDLKSFLLNIIEEERPLLGLDLSAVRFIDSSGLGALVTVLKQIGQNGAMGLWGLNREVRALFELTQLYKVFDIFETERDALLKLQQHVPA